MRPDQYCSNPRRLCLHGAHLAPVFARRRETARSTGEMPDTIELVGAACDAVMEPPVPSIDIIFGCPPDGGPPIL
jgi:hypothetical protein